PVALDCTETQERKRPALTRAVFSMGHSRSAVGWGASEDVARRSALLHGAHQERAQQHDQGNAEQELTDTAGDGRRRTKAKRSRTDRCDQEQHDPTHGDLPEETEPGTISVEQEPDDDEDWNWHAQ